MLELLFEAFPEVPAEEVRAAFRQCSNDVIATIRKLDGVDKETSQAPCSEHIELTSKDFPSLVPAARSSKAENCMVSVT
jgi:hypothetical protein